LILTVANLITLLRVVLIPFFLVALLYQDYKIAFFIFLCAGISDALDGFIARFFKQKTQLGAIMDPIADKLMLATAFISLAVPQKGEAYIIPIWVAVLVLSRDVVIIIFVIIQFLFFDAEIKHFMPSIWGKITTTLQISYAVGVLFFNAFSLPIEVINYLMWLVVAFTLISGFHYLWRARKIEVQ